MSFKSALVAPAHDDGGNARQYEQTVAALADLSLLVGADLFVGTYNSNWGRLAKTMRHGRAHDETAFVFLGEAGAGAARRQDEDRGDDQHTLSLIEADDTRWEMPGW